jgi:general secretion pathway protein G
MDLKNMHLKKVKGLTYIELMLGIMILSIVSIFAHNGYESYKLRVKIATAKSDLVSIESKIQMYYTQNHKLPDALTDIYPSSYKDPWGNPYSYLKMEGLKGVGKVRKDKNLHPINSDYDLYSMGPDGKSASPLTAAISQDDIIRANNGDFIGVAKDY